MKIKSLMCSLLLTMFSAEAGLLDLVKIPVASSFVVGGALLGKQALTEWNNINSTSRKIKDTMAGGSSSFEKTKEAANQLMKEKKIDQTTANKAGDEIAQEGERLFKRYAPFAGYAFGSITCLIIGAKVIKSIF